MPYELDSEIRSRLVHYYQQVSDKELLDAVVKLDDLTPMAQEVVHTELVNRGLGRAWPNENNAPSSDSSADCKADLFSSTLPKPEFGTAIEKGRVALITLYDAIAAGQACDLLDEAGVELEVTDLSQTEGRGSFYGGNPVALQLIVNEKDRDRSVKLLCEKMGLFPLEEIGDPDAPIDDGSIATVGQFAKRSDAEDVACVLTDAKVWNRITANPDGSAATEDAFLVEVREVDLVGAGELVEKALNLPEV